MLPTDVDISELLHMADKLVHYEAVDASLSYSFTFSRAYCFGV